MPFTEKQRKALGARASGKKTAAFGNVSPQKAKALLEEGAAMEGQKKGIKESK